MSALIFSRHVGLSKILWDEAKLWDRFAVSTGIGEHLVRVTKWRTRNRD
jgi:hypothetical protein